MNTAAYEDFLKSAESRETSDSVMQAIVRVSESPEDAARIWKSPTREEFIAVWEMSTGNGRVDDAELFWGDNSLHELQQSWN